MAKLLEKVRAVMRVRHYSYNTEKVSCRRFIKTFRRELVNCKFALRRGITFIRGFASSS
jgi:hypothetical protein